MNERKSGDWEISEDSNSEVKKVVCPECGEETVVFATLAVAADEVECSNCGHTKKLGAPSPFWVLLMVVGALIYVKLRQVVSKAKNIL